MKLGSGLDLNATTTYSSLRQDFALDLISELQPLTKKVVSASVAPKVKHGRFAVGITDIRGIGVEGSIVTGSRTEPPVHGRGNTITTEDAIAPVVHVGDPCTAILTDDHSIIVLERGETTRHAEPKSLLGETRTAGRRRNACRRLRGRF